jgi:hypothetical protein
MLRRWVGGCRRFEGTSTTYPATKRHAHKVRILDLQALFLDQEDLTQQYDINVSRQGYENRAWFLKMVF